MSIPRRWQAQPSTGLRLFGFRRSPGGFVGRPNRRDRCQERHGETRHQIATVTATFQIASSQIATVTATSQRHQNATVIATSQIAVVIASSQIATAIVTVQIAPSQIADALLPLLFGLSENSAVFPNPWGA